MSPTKLLTPIIIAALTLFGTATLQAGKGGGGKPGGGGGGKYAKKEPAPPHHTTIVSISADSISIKGSADAKTYKITRDTVIEYKGQRAKLDDLKSGMRVSVTPGSDPTVAGRISASEAPEDPVPTPAKDKNAKGKK